jgi:hypothetical protein
VLSLRGPPELLKMQQQLLTRVYRSVRCAPKALHSFACSLCACILWKPSAPSNFGRSLAALTIHVRTVALVEHASNTDPSLPLSQRVSSISVSVTPLDRRLTCRVNYASIMAVHGFRWVQP